jgi:signal peptidase II
MNSEVPSRVPALLMLLAVLTLDQATKYWAQHTLADHPPEHYFGVLTLIYAKNFGAWGSLGASWGPAARWVVLSVIPGILLLVFWLYTLQRRATSATELMGISILVAGGYGNLIDRFRLGYVQDFLYLGYGSIGTNIFNVADMAILVGVGLMVYGSQKRERHEKALPITGS